MWNKKRATFAIASILVVVASVALWVGVRNQRHSRSTGPLVPSKNDLRSQDREEKPARPEDLVPLRSAQSLGLRGWQPTEYRREDSAGVRLTIAHAAAASAATSRPRLTFIDGEEPGLAGTIDPTDAEAIALLPQLHSIGARGMSDVPPARHLRSICGLAAVAVSLVSSDPSAEALLGPKANDEAKHRMEAAASQWPAHARVWKVIAVPPNSRPVHGASMTVKFESEPKEFEHHVRSLRASGLLTFDPIESGFISARVSFPYQNSDQQDLELAMQFAFDRASDSWVLLKISSSPGSLEMRRLANEHNVEAINASISSLYLPDVLPDCLVTTDGILRSAK